MMNGQEQCDGMPIVIITMASKKTLKKSVLGCWRVWQ